MENKHIINKTINTLSRLPGIGERSAQRIVFYLMQKKESLLSPLINHLDILLQEIKTCDLCNNIDISNPCNICSNFNRTHNQICIVEDIASLWALEKSKAYNGVYFILEGTLKFNNSNELEQKKIPKLLNLVTTNNITEIILATSLTVEGQTTALYIKEEIKNLNNNILVSTLAQGVPVGGEIDYLDELTLETAIKLRKSI